MERYLNWDLSPYYHDEKILTTTIRDSTVLWGLIKFCNPPAADIPANLVISYIRLTNVWNIVMLRPWLKLLEQLTVGFFILNSNTALKRNSRSQSFWVFKLRETNKTTKILSHYFSFKTDVIRLKEKSFHNIITLLLIESLKVAEKVVSFSTLHVMIENGL